MRTVKNLAGGWKIPVFDNGEKNEALPLCIPAGEAPETLTLTHEIEIAEDEKNAAFYLETRFLSGKCRVFLDGEPAGAFRSVFAPRYTDLTALIRKGQKQELRLEITPEARPDGQFTFGAAALIGTELSHFAISDETEPVTVRTVFSDAGVRVLMHAEIENPNNYDVVLFRLCSPEGILIDVKSARPTAANAAFDPEAPALWDGAHAADLYRAEVILQRDSDMIDYTETSFGVRQFEACDAGFFRLNGIKLPLNGALLRGAGTAEDLECLTELDANLVGLNVLDPDEETLRRCDALGIMVYFEFPDTGDDRDFEELGPLTRMLAAHPSVALLGYRSRDLAYGKKFCSTVKQNAQYIFTAGRCDVLNADALSDALPDVLVLPVEVRPERTGFTELGKRFGEVLAEHPDYRFAVLPAAPECIFDRHSAGAVRPDCSQEYFSKWHASVWNVFSTHKNTVCYFTGYLADRAPSAERTGLVLWDRSAKKDAYWFYKAKFSAADFVKLASLPATVTKKTVDVKCYTNARSLTLLVNGKTKKRYTPARLSENVYVFENVKLRRKKNVIELKCDAGTDTAEVFRSKSRLKNV